MTDTMYYNAMWLLVLAALLLSGSGTALIVAMDHHHNLESTPTQRRRYYLFASAAAIASIPVASALYQFGLHGSIELLLAFYRTDPSWGIVCILLMITHVLTIVLWPLLAFYAYKRPARFAHKVYIWEGNRPYGYYVRHHRHPPLRDQPHPVGPSPAAGLHRDVPHRTVTHPVSP